MVAKGEPVGLDHWIENVMFTDRADFSIDEYASRCAESEDFDVRGRLLEWQERGIVVFENAVDTALIDEVLDDIEYLNEHSGSIDLEVEYRGRRMPLSNLDVSPLSDTGIKLNCIENISLAARRLSLNRFVCRFLRHVFQESPVVLQSLTFWRGSEQPPHLDYPYVRTQTRLPHLAASWTPLEDIHADAGPLAYYPGSHREGVIAPFDWGGGSLVFEADNERTPDDFSGYLREQIASRGLKQEVFLPKRGDVLIWHGNVLHEGTHVNDRARTRKSYVSHYTSLGAYPPEHMMTAAIERGLYTQLNGGYVFDHPWVSQSRVLPSWSAINPKET